MGKDPTKLDSDENRSEQIKTMLRAAIQKASPHLARMEKMQEAYECNIPDDWQTYSEIFLPLIRTAVEELLPDAYNYLFPTSSMLSLVPREPLPFDKVKAAQDYFEDYIRNKSGLKKEGYLTLKDTMKVNLGYGIVETAVITPPTSILTQIISNEETVDLRKIEIGEPKEVAVYRYVDWRQVIPMPDGRDPDHTSGVFFLDDVREDTLEDMYAMDATREVPILKGDPKKIIQDVRSGKTSMDHYPLWWVWGSFAGGDPITNAEALNYINKITVSENAPVRIPILKCYFKREHIWMTPDGTIIHHIKDKIQTLRCPIKKATATPDGDNWFVKGDVECGRDAADGANVFQNALMDILSHNLHPTRIINRQIVHDGDAMFEPHGIVEVFGNANDAVTYTSTPQLPGGIAGIGGDLQDQFGVAIGRPRELRGQGTPGVMRGGGLAFESLQQGTMARSKLASAILEINWLQSTIEDLIIMIQVLGMDDSYIERDHQTKAFVEKTITSNDFNYAFAVSVVLDDKLRQTASDKAMDMQLYQLIKNNPRYDFDEVEQWIVETLKDRETAKRLRATPDVYAKQVQDLQAQQAAARQAEEQPEGEQVSQRNPAMQAQQGVDAERMSR